MAVKIKLDGALYDRVKKVADIAGYASAEEPVSCSFILFELIVLFMNLRTQSDVEEPALVRVNVQRYKKQQMVEIAAGPFHKASDAQPLVETVLVIHSHGRAVAAIFALGVSDKEGHVMTMKFMRAFMMASLFFCFTGHRQC